ncbi:MAG: peptidylprolyl isomerase, partial [Acidimicrobiia bacterium]|nr:peptidylprolyl isomerase [Acidimicrobiia bacterium]
SSSSSTTAGGSTTSSSAPAVTVVQGPDAPAGTLPTVAGAMNAKPQLTIPKADPPTALQTQVITPGSGPAVGKGDTVELQYVGVTWGNRTQFDSSWDRKTPSSFAIGVGQVVPGFDKGLTGAKVGSRMLLVMPPADGYGSTGNSKAGISGTDTLVFVVDLLKTFPPALAADGVVQPPDTSGKLPTVEGARDAKPTVKVPSSVPAPTALVANPIIKGTGPVVTSGQTVIVQFVAFKWADGNELGTTWDGAGAVSFPVGSGQVLPGWEKGLTGASVGSRMLLVLPPAEAYGPAGNSNAGVSPTDTLVFVMDVLGAY